MSAQPLAWHRQCFANVLKTLEDEEANLQRVQERVAGLRASANLYREQIEAAEREGKEAFDSERYKVARKARP